VDEIRDMQAENAGAPDDTPDESASPALEAPSDAEVELLPGSLERREQQALLTALLFASGEVLSDTRLGTYFGLAPQDLSLLAEEAAAALRLTGLDIVSAAGGYKLVTAAQWDDALRVFYRQVRKSKLSRNALEILAVIAYEQPVTRVKIDELRQANSESAVRTLLERRLITVAGREEGPGKPFKYKTTAAFLELFGLASLADLPPRPVSFDVSAGRGEDGLDIDGVAEDAADEFLGEG
jgi:segregation and condensation protein B